MLKEGWTYPASIMDIYDRKIIGYAYGKTLTADLAPDTVKNDCLNVSDTNEIVLHSDLDTDNSRNGHSQKTLHTDYGDMNVSIPRDRNGEYEPQIIKKYQNTVTQDMEKNHIHVRVWYNKTNSKKCEKFRVFV